MYERASVQLANQSGHSNIISTNSNQTHQFTKW